MDERTNELCELEHWRRCSCGQRHYNSLKLCDFAGFTSFIPDRRRQIHF